MARPKKKILKSSKTNSKISYSKAKTTSSSESVFTRIQNDIENRQNLISLVLGVLIVLVIGALLFNFFNKPNGELGPSQQTSLNAENTQPDVKKDELPGKYTVKAGDTLFTIAQSYYNDGYKFSEIAQSNKLANPNALEVGQVLDIPKVNATLQNASPTPVTPNTTLNADQTGSMSGEDHGMGGAINQTMWGETISDDTYKVQAGDWLSKISGRAYGDIYQFDKIAKANNLKDPNSIEPGTVLKIPRT